MNIGLFAGPTFRPHPEHVSWLGQLAKAGGHRVVGLSCDGAVSDCYGKALLGRSRMGCIPCSLAGLRAYPGIDIQSARALTGSNTPNGWKDAEVLSSVRTILREEDDLCLGKPEATALMSRLAAPAAQMYAKFCAWIQRERLDAVLVFNGRMDVTRAAIRAAQHCAIRFAAIERASFDTGVRVTPMADCNSLRSEHRLQATFCDAPLLADQAAFAADFIARRVMRMPVSEWRSYNPDRVAAEWPHRSTGVRVLVGPSSQYEVRGEEGWEELGDMREAVDDVVERLGHGTSVVVRGHPVWGETIAGASGESAARYYRDWCSQRGYAFIEPDSKADTRSLMMQADIVLATGGTIGIEAACAGRAVLALAPCYYQASGAVGNAVGRGSSESALMIRQVAPRERIRRALRAIYTHAYRSTQYCRFMRPIPGSQGAEWEYRSDADFSQVERALVSGFTQADDERVASDTTAEDAVIDLMQREQWEEIVRDSEMHRRGSPNCEGEWRRLQLSVPARVLLSVRSRLPKGDRLRGAKR